LHALGAEAFMRSAAHLEGHPIHPMLIPFPFAYLFGSVCIDAWARATERPGLFRTATHLNAIGIGCALAAAVPGIVDYVFAVPPKSSARTRATDHAVSNISALALFALARLGRNHGEDRPAAWALAAEVAGAALLAMGGWMGGTLVYRNQIGVDHRYANAGKWRVAPLLPEGDPLDVAADDELKVDQMKLLRVGDRRIVLARTDRGHVAFDDRCTHKGGSLADGSLACGTVQCPWHGSQFDVQTGEVRQGPAEDAVRTYPVSEREGRVWLSISGDRPH
jgi:nitrite reductase/ring-hydroxylating ferredoxin subunit/uncharacterized membrane protein